jgi:benzoyl-CoA-dihydrodiol lyase
VEPDRITYSSLRLEIDRDERVATFLVLGPETSPPASPDEAVELGAGYWPLRLARELDDAILHMRVNELEIGTWVVRSEGNIESVLGHDAFLLRHAAHWLIREVVLLWSRVLRRVDMTSRSIIALVEPGSCFGGVLAELLLAADRSYMLIGAGQGDRVAEIVVTASNRFAYPMWNGLSRLETRFWGDPDGAAAAVAALGRRLDAEAALAIGLVTEAYDDLDWDDEIRLVLEERSSFSPDGLTGMEANLRFPGPETMETKIFGRLTAWQNWVFQRPNASGENGALRRYGTGIRPDYDPRRA